MPSMSQYKSVARAAALKYRADSPQNAPMVVASGMGYAAEKIVEIAENSHVPVFQDDSLATLLSQLQAGSQIPPSLYQAVVDIYLYFLNFVPGDAPAAAEQPKDAAPAETPGADAEKD